jgi:GntR family transcriptional regulator/MocR family aminotransferase
MAPLLGSDWQTTPVDLPLFQRIAESIAREVRRGRLRPAERLPSSRSLARQLEVNRNTVLAAYEELERQGYVVMQAARGTFVAADLPDRQPRDGGKAKSAPVRFGLPAGPASVAPDTLKAGTLALVGGIPDLRSLPVAALARAYRRALKSTPSLLDYQSAYGHPRLLLALSNFLRDARGVVAGAGEIMTTRGSQQALHLAARALVRPNSVIAVERYGYSPAWEAFRLAGASLVPITVDSQGLFVPALERLAAERDLVGVYVTPHHQYPTTVTLSAARRMQLLRLAEERRFCLLEDDYDHEHHFEGRPVLPLASADPRGVVIHIGTLSKVFAPGLRLGYAVAQAPIIEKMAAYRRYIDRQGDHATELALSYLIEDGELSAHIRRMHRLYQERRQVFCESLRSRLGGALSFQVPAGGLALWARLSVAVSAERWCEEAQRLELLVHPASRFRFDGTTAPYLRLGFPRHNAPEIREAVRRLERALRQLQCS